MKRLIRFDWAIKKLLRDKVNFAILEGFISELIKEDVKIIEVLESKGNKQSEDDKFNKVDLLVKDSHDRLVLIEVQNEYELDYFQRILYGASRLITEYIKEGEVYRNIKRVISVSIVYFDLGQGEDYVYYGSTSFRGIHKHDELKLTAKQEKVYMNDEISSLFPEYYLIETERFNDILHDKLDEWVYFFKNGEIKEEFDAKGIQMANDSLDITDQIIVGLNEKYNEGENSEATIPTADTAGTK
jgi:predicted transposase/invertase (TIGR01784 family)